MATMYSQAKNEGKEGFEMGANGADKNRGLRLLTGVLLILRPSAFNVLFALLLKRLGPWLLLGPQPLALGHR